MSTTVSWNLQLAVREGSLDDVRKLMDEMVAATRQEPGAQRYEWFLSEDGEMCHINESYADSAATMVHLGNFSANFADRFLGLLEPRYFSVYGKPSAEVRAALDAFGARYLAPLGGFSR